MLASPPPPLPDPASACKIVHALPGGVVVAVYPAGERQRVYPIRMLGKFWLIKWC